MASNNKKRIKLSTGNKRYVAPGSNRLAYLKSHIFVKSFFQKIGSIITHIEAFAKEGAAFVYGGLMAVNSAGGAVPYRTPGVFILWF
jgi:nucleoside permease NupC